MKKNLLSTFLFLYSGLLIADSASYSSSDNTLKLPDVSVNEQIWVNVKLKLDTNGQYVVEDYEKLSDSEKLILTKMNTFSCGTDDILGKLAAKNAFISGNKNYCLKKEPVTGDEPGYCQSYLIIENEDMQISTDCRTLTNTNIKTNFNSFTGFYEVKFGYLENDIFIEETAIEQIDFEREYTLKLSRYYGGGISIIHYW